MKTAIIIGHKGQDGTLMRISLEQQGYEVVGIGRNETYRTGNGAVACESIDIQDRIAVQDVMRSLRPAEVYYLAAYHTASQEKVTVSPFDEFCNSQQVHVTGLLHFLDAMQRNRLQSRLFYAASSLVFSGEDGPVQDEQTRLTPTGFYGITKAEGMLLCGEYRKQYGIFASVGILYNHESSLRQPKFLSQKIIQAAIRIANGSSEKLEVGDLNARVDWSYAPDFIDAFQRVLRCDQSDDFIIASGTAHQVKEFIEIVFNYFGLRWEDHVVENKTMLARSIPVKSGNISRIMEKTGWRNDRGFESMVRQLIIDSMNREVSPV